MGCSEEVNVKALFNVLVLFVLSTTGAEAATSFHSDSLNYDIRCRDFTLERRPFFGDTHVHTKYSLDASTQGTRTTPAEAYQFAKGARIGIQPWSDSGEPLRTTALARPLDFAMVTDHAELFGEVNICTTPGHEGFDSWQCKFFRGWPRGAFFVFNTVMAQADRLGFCGDDGALCLQAGLGPWREMQQAAEAAYDRTANCEFTSFVAYEWTGTAGAAGNLHRNVIFRNAQVPTLPISFVDAPSAGQLYDHLDSECVNAGTGCDVIVIPHNANLSNGDMFNNLRDDGSPVDAEDARQIARLETLVEVMQHKGNSECYFGPGQGEDELCAFEQLPYDKFSGKMIPLLREAPAPNDGFLREVLRDGIREQRRTGVNPFKWGFVASTDTHLGTPGLVSEKDYLGHGGAGDPVGNQLPKGLTDDLEFNPGGLAVLWAEQNSRDSLFAAMRRKEAYGTSGPRISLRFFGGWNYPESMCEQAEFAKTGYSGGVPMGGDLRKPSSASSPIFAVQAMKDPGTSDSVGMPLQRIQIIKGWVDADGRSQEKVFEVAGDPNNGAGVDISSCVTHGAGFQQLCTVWKDPEFDSSAEAFYYARVVENPSCRWSQYICSANQVDCANPATIGEGLEACCAADHRPIIQERAWSSPIWYAP